jgi:hypothetical protein
VNKQNFGSSALDTLEEGTQTMTYLEVEKDAL